MSREIQEVNPRVPVVLVTGTSPEAMARVTVGLQWELPRAVVVEHRIDVEQQRLHRTVSDIDGLVDRAAIDLAHACASCAISEDVLPTLARLGAAGRWQAIVVHLPVGAQAPQVCRALRSAEGGAAATLRIGGVVAAVAGDAVVQDLLGDDLLAERGLHSAREDRRGVGEVLAAMVEYADVVVLAGAAGPVDRDLVRALARPDALVADDVSTVDGRPLLAGVHVPRRSEAWAALVQADPPALFRSEHVWRLQLQSDRPFHPERLRANIASLGGGPRRVRGCFWLPSRPGDVVSCAGAGGQFSVGGTGSWNRREPFTRILVTGLDDGRHELVRAFDESLLTGAEVDRRGCFWEVAEDGLEDWLGEIRRIA